MDIADWRRKIDELDRQLVRLINERAHCAEEIGKLKRNSSLPIYEPDRERIIFNNIQRENRGPLTEVQLRQVYERLVERVRTSGVFQKVYRMGDHAADGVPDLVILHTKVDTFKEGSQTKRELVTVVGSTKVDVTASVTNRDGKSLMDQKITGRVRFFGENLGVTNDLAKRITKLVRESF